MQDDRLDRRVVAEFLELSHDRLGRKDDAVEIDNPNAVAKAADPGFAGARMHA